MGLITNNNNGRSISYLNISHGKINVRCNKRDENGRSVRDENGSFVQDNFQADGVEGFIKSIAVRKDIEVTFNGTKQLIDFVDIILTDGNEDFILSLDKTSGFLESIVMALATVPSFAGHKVKIKTWLSNKNGKDYTNISLRLDDEKLGWIVAPGDRPALEPVVVNGKTVYDRTKRVSFVMEHLAKVQAVLAADTQAPVVSDEGEQGYIPAPDLDDMPGDDLPM